MATKKKLRSSGAVEIYDLSLAFPHVATFDVTKLPLLKTVIGNVLHQVTERKLSYEAAIHETGQQLYHLWIRNNTYPVTIQTIKNRLSKHIKEFRDLSKRSSDRQNEQFVSRTTTFIDQCNQLFDIFCEDEVKREKLEDQYDLPMIQKDWDFLECMRGDRKGHSEKKGDVSWHRERDKEREKSRKRVQRQQMQQKVVSSSQLEIEGEEDVVSSTLVTEEENSAAILVSEPASVDTLCRKRKKFVPPSEFIPSISTRSSSTTEPPNHTAQPPSTTSHHVRLSENLIRNEIYQTFAELDGHGFSYHQSLIATQVIANRVFGCKWKLPDESDRVKKSAYDSDDEEIERTFDIDTLPTRRSIRRNLKKIEVQSLKLTAEKIVDASAEEHLITHSTDSTTRKKVGCFAPQGIHINRDEFYPLPTLQISSETTDNVAESIKTDFEMLSAASGKSATELYSCVDLHMTDATRHNKGISEKLSQKLEREDVAGQLFCNPHTALGFDRAISGVANEVETKMGLEKIFQGFVLDVNIDEKNDAVSLNTVSWVLNLFGPDCIQKPWNYHKDFTIDMNKKGKKVSLFQMKDFRFGALSKSCAVVCYHWQDFVEFLEGHDYVTNKLACLVRDGMSNEYIKPVIAVTAAFGIHVIQPYFAKCKGNSTHSQLRDFFQNLNNSLRNKEVLPEFFDFNAPFYDGVSQRTFDGVKKDYSVDVVDAVKSFAHSFRDECVELANIIAQRLSDVLEAQRGKFYGFGSHEPEYPVFEQAHDIDRAITHNLQMERSCGDHDYRFQTKCDVAAVSRGNILKYTTTLRDEDDPGGFRKLSSVVKVIDNIRADWNVRQQKLAEAGLSSKETQKLNVDNRKLTMLEKLKQEGGPFTSIEEIDFYLSSSIDEKTKQNRMKDEVTYARDSSKSLPRKSTLFNIFYVDKSTKKRRLFTADEYGENLRNLLGKVSDRSSVTMETFRQALSSCK